MATTAPDNISGWKFPNEDKKKKKNQQNTTYKTSQPTPSAVAEPINTSVYKNNGGSAKTSAPSVPYEDTVAQKNMQKEVQKAAQKAKQQPKSSIDVPYKTQQTVAQKRQQQKDEQWLSLGSAPKSDKTTTERQNAQSYSGKMEVRSPLVQKQWNSASTTSAQNISKQTERKIPAKSEPDFEKDFKEMWAEYGPRLMGTESTPKTSYGPNSEMANTVKINPQKNTVSKTVASPKPTVNAAGPSAEMGKAVQNSYRPSATADNKQFFNGLAKGLTGVVWPDKDVAGTERIEKQNRQSVQNMGPNTEIGSITKNWNKPLTMDELIDIASKLTGGIGPNSEMKDSVVLENQGWKPEIDTGPNVEIGQKNFLDHRENNVFKSYFDEYRYDKMIEDAYKPQEEYFVGKDSIYKKEPKEISEDYRKVYNTVQPEYLKKKEELADLEFYKKYARLDEEGIKKLEKTKAEVEKLDFVRKKAALGAKMNFAFSGNDMEKLSKMSIDDILNSEETDYNLPYLSPGAQFARSTNQSIGQIKNAVDIVNSVKIEFNERRNEFTVFNSKEPQNRFSFKIKNVRSNQGYTEPKIIVDKTPTDYQELIVKDLRDVMDNLTVPDNTEKMLKNLADNKSLSVVSKGLDGTSKFLDLTDLAVVLSSDLSDDGKAGDDFSGEFFGTAGSWAGDKIGGIAGAKAGAALGMVFGPVGAVIGGTLGAVAGAYIMSKVMEDVGRYVGEGLDDSEYTIDQYHSRAK